MSWPLPGTDGAAAKRQQGAHTIKVHTLTGRVKGSNVILHVTHGEVLTSAKKNVAAVGIWQRPHSEHRFLAPSSLKEGCRKPVLGVWVLM